MLHLWQRNAPKILPSVENTVTVRGAVCAGRAPDTDWARGPRSRGATPPRRVRSLPRTESAQLHRTSRTRPHLCQGGAETLAFTLATAGPRSQAASASPRRLSWATPEIIKWLCSNAPEIKCTINNIFPQSCRKLILTISNLKSLRLRNLLTFGYFWLPFLTFTFWASLGLR